MRDRGIGVGDFAVIKMVFVFFGKRRGRFVGIVGIIEMHPYKVRSRAVFLKPSLGMTDDFHAAAFDAAPALLILAVGIFAVSILAIAFRKVVVKIEAAIEAGSEGVAVENYSSNKSRGLVAMFFQQFSGRDVLGGEWDGKISDAMHARQKAGENRDMRGVGDRAVRESLRKANTVASQGVERGGFDLFVSVAADVISAQRVDRDEVNVWRHAFCRLAQRGVLKCGDPSQYLDEDGHSHEHRPQSHKCQPITAIQPDFCFLQRQKPHPCWP